jgi:flagellin-like protein
MKKKGISPVIATVLLVLIVIVLAMLIFLWARGFIKEAVTKKGLNAEQACGEIDLVVSYTGGNLDISNRGNIPIYHFEIRKISPTGIETQEEKIGVASSDSISIPISGGPYEELEVVPIILGEGEKSKKMYVCKNNAFIA